MKRPTLALLFLSTLAILFVVSLCGCARREGTTQRAGYQVVGTFRLSVENKPKRPTVGDNLLRITLRDSAGRPVGGATVNVVLVMQAMGTMPRMEARGVVREAGPGAYEARYGISMAGEWDVELALSGPDGSDAVATYRLSTSTDQLRFVSGTPPAGASTRSAAADTTGAKVEGVVLLDPARLQAIGVRTAVVGTRPLRIPIRAAGKVAYDETRRAEISLKFSGWVRQVFVDYTGQVIRRGQPLFTVYSPELFSAQQEFLESLRGVRGGAPGAQTGDPELAEAARQRLLLWDIAPSQIDAIARAGKPMEAVPIVAPSGGVVVEKNIVRGSSFTAGQPLYRIAPVHPVWVVASVYQHELPLVRRGMTAMVEAPFLPGGSRAGRVSTINPYLDPGTRTGEVRLTVANEGGDLKPGMFVNVLLERDLGERLAVPASAVLFEGDRRIVFVDLGGGRLAPRAVELGPKAGDYYVVERGLAPGEVVVVSGNFLIAAESKLQSAVRR